MCLVSEGDKIGESPVITMCGCLPYFIGVHMVYVVDAKVECGLVLLVFLLYILALIHLRNLMRDSI